MEPRTRPPARARRGRRRRSTAARAVRAAVPARLRSHLPARLRPDPPARSRPRRPSRRAVLAAALLAVAAVAVFAGVGYVTTEVPTRPQDGVTDQGSVVYYADGSTPIFRLGANREVVAHDRIPDHLRWAVLSAEDRGFYDEPGVSAQGMVRALWSTASGAQVQGGSTITQQLARNYYRGLSRDRSLGRKIREIFISVKLDRRRSKDEILDLYLNTVYFGRQASGVQAAARAYFHKDVQRLTVAESALLAAMIQRPAYFHTQGDDEQARALRDRWNYVVKGMTDMGRLSRAQASALTFPDTQREWNTEDPSGQSPFVRQRVQEELQELHIPMEQVFNGGLKIYTGLDQRWMEEAARAVRGAGETGWPASVRAGLVSVDPANGTVKAFYGGDPHRGQYDSVFNPIAQAGSTFKPYVLAAALKKGYNVRSVVDGNSPQKFAPNGETTPMTAPGMLVRNDDKIGSVGPVDLVKATALSVNTGYVQLGFRAGIDNVLTIARRLGVPREALAPFKGQAGVVLGTPTVSAVDQAAGYAAFANGGKAVTPHLITKIVDSHGQVLHVGGREGGGVRVLTAEQASQVGYALRAVVTDGTGTRAALPGRDAAGKTGTTDDNRAAWFVGYVPQLSTAVVMTDLAGKPLRTTGGKAGGERDPGGDRRGELIDGGSVPAEIWRSFMIEATAGLPVRRFTEPSFDGRRETWTTPSPGVEAGGPKPPCGPPGVPACPGTGQAPGHGADALDSRKVAACKKSKDPAGCLRALGMAVPPRTPRPTPPDAGSPRSKASGAADTSQGRTGAGR